MIRYGPEYLQSARVRHSFFMMKAKQAAPAHMIVEDNDPVEKGYADWKRAKIEHGLTQAKDRAAMIAAEQVWRELGFEG